MEVDDSLEVDESSGSDSTSDSCYSSFESAVLTVGRRVRAEFRNSGKWAEAEITEIRKIDGETFYYVHYVSHSDNRLDEWVPKARLNIGGITPRTPRKKIYTSSISSSSLSSLSSFTEDEDPSPQDL